MTKRQKVISIPAVAVIAACTVLEFSYPPSAQVTGAVFGGTVILFAILALSPWGRSKD